MKPLLVITTAAISFTAVASFRPIHNADDYNQVIANPDHESSRVPPIGWDDSTGEFLDGGQSFNPPTTPEVDVNPDEEIPVATEVKINCGCALPLLASDGSVEPIRGECFDPKRTKDSMTSTLGLNYYLDSYGDFWPDSNNVEFIATFNTEGDSPTVTKIELFDYESRSDRTTEIAALNIFAFKAPLLDVSSPSCEVQLVSPARVYQHQGWMGGGQGGCASERDYFYVNAGYSQTNFENVGGSSPGVFLFRNDVYASCNGIINTKYHY